MSARVIRFPPQPRLTPDMTLDACQRAWLAVEDALNGDWSDSNLIALLAHAAPAERQEIVAQLAARAPKARRPRVGP